ncbi:MAG: IS1634 family transposase [Bacteroidetes bacterium]|nr:IS1634 family transposase [Bacteroidota bacterium]
MFIRKKPNKSGLISVQVIDKSLGKYRVIQTIGSSSNPKEVERLVHEGKRFIEHKTGIGKFDFTDYKSLYTQVLSTIQTHKMVGIHYVLGKIFDEIGFNHITDALFRDLVLYRLIYPKSKLRTTEYLQRYEQKYYSEDDIYRYMDKLQATQKEVVQKISFKHTLCVLKGDIQAVFYDVTTIYFEIEREDELRKTGFSKEGKHQHPQIVLGLLVSRDAYPLAYDIFEGNKYEGDTFLPILQKFKEKYQFEKITVVADAGLLSAGNVQQLIEHGYDFILGARIKNEKQSIKDAILRLKLTNGQSKTIKKDDLRMIVTYSDDRAKKDTYNRERGLKKLEKQIQSGKLTKSSINNKGYNKFLRLEGNMSVSLDHQKAQQDALWDGLKGYLTNSTLTNDEILENYRHLWQIEKAFRVAKSELKIRPVYHYKRRRIEAHICLNFTAYKVYKELERQLKEKGACFSAEKTIEIIQNIYQLSLITPNNEVITKTIILTDEQRQIQELFKF